MGNYLPKSAHAVYRHRNDGWHWIMQDYFHNSMKQGGPYPTKRAAMKVCGDAIRDYRAETEKLIAERKAGEIKALP